MAALDGIKERIRNALKAQEVYSESMELFIDSFANVLQKQEVATVDFKKLKKLFVLEKTREGNSKRVQHPAVKTSREYDKLSLEYLQAACLTPSTSSDSNNDEVTDLINEVNEADDGE